MKATEYFPATIYVDLVQTIGTMIEYGMRHLECERLRIKLRKGEEVKLSDLRSIPTPADLDDDSDIEAGLRAMGAMSWRTFTRERRNSWLYGFMLVETFFNYAYSDYLAEHIDDKRLDQIWPVLAKETPIQDKVFRWTKTITGRKLGGRGSGALLTRLRTNRNLIAHGDVRGLEASIQGSEPDEPLIAAKALVQRFWRSAGKPDSELFFSDEVEESLQMQISGFRMTVTALIELRHIIEMMGMRLDDHDGAERPSG